MLDVEATLSPRTGLVTEVAVFPPAGATAPLWTVACNIDGTPPDDDGYVAALVGACGFSRADTLVRAAGEAVERAALRPGPGPPGDEDSAVVYVHPLSGQLATGERPAGHRWYLGTDLSTGEPVSLPAGLVDHPVVDGGGADDSPSGAAAGSSLDMAVRAALLEIIERDAAMVAWHRRLVLPTLDLDQLCAHPVRPLADAVTRVRGALDPGSTLVVTLVPSAVAGVVCCVALLVERTATGQLGAVGSSAGERWPSVVAGAVRESLQVRGLMRGVAAPPPAEVPAPPLSAIDRVRLWTTREAVRHLDEWSQVHHGVALPPPTAAACLGNDELVAGIVADGGRPVVIRLTDRLPAAIRGLGWEAVKVVCPGYQRLVMDETREAVLLRPRLDRGPARLGFPATAVAEEVPPHPWV